MRYVAGESVALVGKFTTGANVTVTITKLSDGSVEVGAAACSELASGYFQYDYEPSAGYDEYLWVMTDGIDEVSGSFVIDGWPSSLISGGGLTEKVYTLTDASTGLPLPGVQVWATTDLAGLNQVDITRTTDDAGQVIFKFNLAAGTTVYIWNRYMTAGTAPDTEVI